MSDNHDAIVIGSGLGGLVAGALSARRGKRVLVLERNASFGGAVGIYERGPLTIESSLHEPGALLSWPRLSGRSTRSMRIATLRNHQAPAFEPTIFSSLCRMPTAA